MRSIAIIGSGEMAVIIADHARRTGIATHSFSNNSTDRVCGHSDRHYNIDIFDIDEIVSVCRDLNVVGVIPTTELTIGIAAKVSYQLGLNGMPVEIAERVTHKDFIRECATKVKLLNQPVYMVCKSNGELPNIKKYPVIVKPTSMGGKRGVSVADNEESLKSALAYAVSNASTSKSKIIIEGFIAEGIEYSVEGLSYHGSHKIIQVTEKITSGPPHCVELGHMQPAALTRELRQRIEAAVISLLQTVGVDNTASHTEIKVVNNDIYLIELNARMGGDHIAYPLTELSTGYSFVQGAIQVAMNTYLVPDTSTFRQSNCGVLFVAKQTDFLKELFDTCENYQWLYKKNLVTDSLLEIVNNQSFDTNYLIYQSGADVPIEIRGALEKIKMHDTYDEY